jgi:hypothetical protein
MAEWQIAAIYRCLRIAVIQKYRGQQRFLIRAALAD